MLYQAGSGEEHPAGRVFLPGYGRFFLDHAFGTGRRSNQKKNIHDDEGDQRLFTGAAS